MDFFWIWARNCSQIIQLARFAVFWRAFQTFFNFKVARQSGARGTVGIPFTTEEGTAKAGKDYEHVEGELLFNNEENS